MPAANVRPSGATAATAGSPAVGPDAAAEPQRAGVEEVDEAPCVGSTANRRAAGGHAQPSAARGPCHPHAKGRSSRRLPGGPRRRPCRRGRRCTPCRRRRDGHVPTRPRPRASSVSTAVARRGSQTIRRSSRPAVTRRRPSRAEARSRSRRHRARPRRSRACPCGGRAGAPSRARTRTRPRRRRLMAVAEPATGNAAHGPERGGVAHDRSRHPGARRHEPRRAEEAEQGGRAARDRWRTRPELASRPGIPAGSRLRGRRRLLAPGRTTTRESGEKLTFTTERVVRRRREARDMPAACRRRTGRRTRPAGSLQPRGEAAAVGAERERGDLADRRRSDALAPSRRRVRASRNDDRAVVVADRERAAVRMQGDGGQRVAVAAHDADRGRAAAQRGEQVVARGRRVVERDALARQQQRRGPALLAQRLRAEPLRLGGARLARARDRARRARAAPRRWRRPAAPTTPASTSRTRRRARSLAARLASRNSLLRGVELRLVLGAPLQRRRQPRAAVELGRGRGRPAPFARRLASGGGAGAGPRRPRSSQPRSRGHSRRSASWATSTVPSLTVTRRRSASTSSDARARRRGRLELGERDPPADDRARRRPRRRGAAGACARPPAAPVEAAERVLGQPRHRAAGRRRCARRRRAAAAGRALPPQLEQRGREQRQRARLALDVGDQCVLELGLDAQPGALGRAARSRGAARRATSAPTSTWLAPSRRASSG